MNELINICLSCLVICLIIVETQQKAVDKRCPNGCAKACRGVECKEEAEKELSEFVEGLVKKDQLLVQHSPSKKSFIEKVLKKANSGPNVDDSWIGKIGVRSMPSEESRNMRNFKRSLDSTNAKLVETHSSKAGYIQALLDSKSALDKKDHIPTPQEKKKRGGADDDTISKADVQDFVEGLSPADQELLKKFPAANKQLQPALQKDLDSDAGKTSKKELLLKNIHTMVEGLKRTLEEYSSLTKKSGSTERR